MKGFVATVVILVGTVSAPAIAQSGPSFDCTKASNAVERVICKDAEVAKADREMTAAYVTLSAKLSGQAKEHLAKDQVRWIATRNKACLGDTDEIAGCLNTRYASRIANLKASGEGIYPFVSEQAIFKAGKLGKISYSIDILYPQFDGTTADFSVVNRRFADDANKAAVESTPKSDSGIDREQEWTYEQSFRFHRPSANAVTVALQFYGFSGGAHGYGATLCSLVDLRTGQLTGPEGVFGTGDQWLKAMVGMVGEDLKKQFNENPGFDDALEPANLAKTLREASHYCWRADRLELIFNAYEVGPYAAGPYTVEIAYAKLKPLLRAEGPITR